MATKGLADRPWVLLPGTLCTGAVFDPFLDGVGVAKVNRRYVELDRPDVEGYRDVFEEITPDTVVCGFSLGAIVAAHNADQMMPHALMLFGLNPFADDPDKAQWRHALSNDVQRLGGAAALSARNLDVFGATPDTTRDMVFAMAEQSTHSIVAQTELALTRPGALPALAGCTAPVFCLTGSRDFAAPSAQGRVAAKHAPNGRFHELNELGHFALMEDPDACAEVVCMIYEARHEPV